jgi:hypothetical protein
LYRLRDAREGLPMNITRALHDERGIALPMALMTLLLLTTLMLAFAVLSQTEPVIAANQLRVAQARSLAESGFERALWALSEGNANPGAANSLANPLPGTGVVAVTAPAPYDGSQFLTTDTGGFLVTVSTPDPVGSPDIRQIVSIGYTPTNALTDTRPKAHRRIQANVSVLPDMGLEPPCALCVKGGLDIGGSSLIDSTQDTSCGNKVGSYSAGNTDRSGSASIRGAGDTTYNEEGFDFKQNQDPASFNNFTFSNTNLDALKELAKKNGTYYGPGYPNGGTGPPVSSPAWTGAVTFNASNQVNNGIVFVDTADGTNIPTDLSAQTPSNFANVTVHGNPFSGQPGALGGTSTGNDFSGWMIVNGTLSISGNMGISGMVYAVNDFTYNGTGTGGIRGLAISQNIRDTTQTAISDDSSAGGNSRITFNCSNARNRDLIPTTFALVPGSYRELAD